MNLWQKHLIGVGAFVFLVAAVFLIGRVRLARINQALVDDALAAGEAGIIPFDDSGLADLPVPVQRYLSKALGERETLSTVVRLEQRGDFRLGDASSDFIPFTAVQHMTLNPAGFVWEAEMQMAPLMSVNVVDAFTEGHGMLRARLLSTIPVADAAPDPMLDEGELMRYLAEAAWFPQALLPSNGVTWEAVDDRHARATITQGDTSASLLFTFNTEDAIVEVHSEGRGYEQDGEYIPTPWTGRFWSYETINGMWIPTEGEVEWNLPGGDLVYWRGVIESAEYELP